MRTNLLSLPLLLVALRGAEDVGDLIGDFVGGAGPTVEERIEELVNTIQFCTAQLNELQTLVFQIAQRQSSCNPNETRVVRGRIRSLEDDIAKADAELQALLARRDTTLDAQARITELLYQTQEQQKRITFLSTTIETLEQRCEDAEARAELAQSMLEEEKQRNERARRREKELQQRNAGQAALIAAQAAELEAIRRQLAEAQQAAAQLQQQPRRRGPCERRADGQQRWCTIM